MCDPQVRPPCSFHTSVFPYMIVLFLSKIELYNGFLFIRVMKNVLHNEKGRGHPKPVSEEKLMPSILKDINIMFPLLNENCTLSPMSCEYLCISECKCAHRPFYKTSWHYI
jgi:hypothetical protein